MLCKNTLKQILIPSGKQIKLKNYKTDWVVSEDLDENSTELAKEKAKLELQLNTQKLSKVQELLYASHRHAILIIFQGMDASGKDGTIKHVMSGVNPQGCLVYSFKQPSEEDLKHTFLWRYSKVFPERGHIAIFNRSYYEEVLVTKVHPEWLEKQNIPKRSRKHNFWDERYQDINNLEKHLVRNGTVIIKFFLHISKNEQKKRLLERLNSPEKLWKFSPSDLTERKYWNKYQVAYETALNATSTRHAPWYVIPADHKWSAHALVADVIADTIESLNLQFPNVDSDKINVLKQLKNKLLV